MRLRGVTWNSNESAKTQKEESNGIKNERQKASVRGDKDVKGETKREKADVK